MSGSRTLKTLLSFCFVFLFLFSVSGVVGAATYNIDFEDWTTGGFLVSGGEAMASLSNIELSGTRDKGISKYFNISEFQGQMPTQISFHYGFTIDNPGASTISAQSYLQLLYDADYERYLWFTNEEGFSDITIDLNDFAGPSSDPVDTIAFRFITSLSCIGSSPGDDLAGSSLYLSNVELVTVPIPSALLLLGSGLAGIMGLRKKFKKLI